MLAEPSEPATPFRVGRFTARCELGRGGMGVVYEGVDEATGAVVAIKTLREFGGEALYRFKHEFRVLADLRHPNLVRLGELHCESERWFFTMERVKGEPFLRHVRPAAQPRARASGVWPSEPSMGAAVTSPTGGATPAIEPTTRTRVVLPGPGAAVAAAGPRSLVASGRFDEARLRRGLAQLCAGLGALHAAGCVHRDVKPSNVLVDDEGRVVLLDFGLVHDLREHIDAADRAWSHAGTVTFMAPEQIIGGAFAPASDWYAVGVMLFAALLGRLPFDGAADRVVFEKTREDPPDPLALDPSLPVDLAELCRELLARAPSARPDGEAIARRLGLSRRALELAASARESTAPFFGRASELERLAELADRAAAGAPVAVLVTGQPGVGKSELVRRFLARERERRPTAVALGGRCYEQESLPFKAFDGVIDELTRVLVRDGARAASLLAGGAPWLAAMFPVLCRVPQVTSTAAPASSSEARARAFAELGSILGALARRAPLTVFIDDLQWADADSLELLRALIADAGIGGWLLITTARTGDARVTHDASALEQTIPWSDELAVRELAPADACALLDALWPPRERGDRPAREVLDDAGGHPMFLAELVRHARTISGADAEPLQLDDVLWRRCQALAPPARAILEVIAVAGAPLDALAIARATAIAEAEVVDEIDALRGAQLIRILRRGPLRLVEPYHDRLREALTSRFTAGQPPASAASVIDLHLRIGRALLEPASLPEADDAAVFGCVRHLNAARDELADPGDRRELAELNLRAARRACAATAYRAVHDYVRVGLSLAADDAAFAAALGREQLRALYLGGRVGDAASLLEALLRHAPSVDERAALHEAWIELCTWAGAFNAAIDAGRRGLRELGFGLPRRTGDLRVLGERLRLEWLRRGATAAELAALPELCDPRRRAAVRLLVALAPATYFTDSALTILCVLRIAGVSLAHGVTAESSFGFAGYGVLLAGGFGDHAGGYELGEVAQALSARFEDDRLRCKLGFMIGLYLGPWVRPYVDCAELVERAIGWGQRTGDLAYAAYSAGGMPQLIQLAGSPLDHLRGVTERMVELARRYRDRDMAGMNEVRLWMIGALSGAVGGAPTEAELDAALTDDATPMARFVLALHQAIVAYSRRELEVAERAIEAAEARLASQFAHPSLIDFGFYRGLIAAARARTVTGGARRRRLRIAAREARAFTRWADSMPANFRARQRILQAERARAAGDAAAALARLDDAIDAAQHAPGLMALALELGAELADELGDVAAARQRRARAADAYARWGAHAVAARLRP